MNRVILEDNIELLELYKDVDSFLRDAYQTDKGVGAYLEQMETWWQAGVRFVPSWDADYKQLKHIRWVRNQFSHECGFEEQIADDGDYPWLEYRRSARSIV